jgi:hypothetical protein
MSATAETTYSRIGLLAALVLLGSGMPVIAHDLVLVRQPSAEGTAAEPVGGCVDLSEIVRVSADGSDRLLTADFAAACDPAVSFDGEQILFAGRRSAGDRFQVWRMNADGSAAVRITDDAGDAYSPLWVGSLFHLNDEKPTRRIAYLATGHGWLDRVTGLPIAALYTSDLDGAHPWRISYDQRSVFDPDVLANGRLVFAAWRANSVAGTTTRRSLMAVNNDGTDVMAFYDNHDGPPLPHAVRVGRDGRVYFVEANGDSPLGGGDLAFVTLRRPLHSRARLATAGRGAYVDPLPLADGGLLVSYRSPVKGAAYALYRIDAATGERLDLVYAKPGFDILDAQELVPRPTVKGRSSVVDLSKDTGVFFCISSHITDRPELVRLKRGGVSTLRVIEGVPTTDASTDRARGPVERTLGEAPIEDDGSFHIEVPAGMPVRFEVVDGEGTTISRQESWTWVMPREWRGCIGCHEDREMVAPNAMADAFVKPAVRLGKSEEATKP